MVWNNLKQRCINCKCEHSPPKAPLEDELGFLQLHSSSANDEDPVLLLAVWEVLPPPVLSTPTMYQTDAADPPPVCGARGNLGSPHDA